MNTIHPIRTLQLISSGGFFGAEKVVIELSTKLLEMGIDVAIGAIKNLRNPHVEVAEAAAEVGLAAVVFPCKGRLDPRTVMLVRRFVSKEGMSIVHSHGYKSNMYAYLATRNKDIRLIATCHNWLGESPKMRFYARLDRKILKAFDRVVAVSDEVEEAILRSKINRRKTEIINNGVQTDQLTKEGNREAKRNELLIRPDSKVIGTVGRLSEEKGHLILIGAAKRVLLDCPECVFLIVGDGPLRKVLEKKASALGPKAVLSGDDPSSNFRFAGYRSDIQDMYALMDVFVLPSLKEGLPMALLEAMAAGKPVIATNVGAISKAVEDGRTGLLIQPGDVDALSRALKTLLSNPELSARLGRRAREKVEREFSSAIMAKRYYEIYEEVIQKHSSAMDRKA